MTFSEDTHRRRRRRGLLGKLRNPRTWWAVVKTAYVIYRVIRWVIEVVEPPS